MANLDSHRTRQHRLGGPHCGSDAAQQRGRVLSIDHIHGWLKPVSHGAADVRRQRARRLHHADQHGEFGTRRRHATGADFRQRPATDTGGERHSQPRCQLCQRAHQRARRFRPRRPAFPAGREPLAAQLQTVARIIKVRSTLGLSRQIFYCYIDGFDTHGGQLGIQDSLLQQVSKAVSAFYQATQELGVDQNVTRSRLLNSGAH